MPEAFIRGIFTESKSSRNVYSENVYFECSVGRAEEHNGRWTQKIDVHTRFVYANLPFKSGVTAFSGPNADVIIDNYYRNRDRNDLLTAPHSKAADLIYPSRLFLKSRYHYALQCARRSTFDRKCSCLHRAAIFWCPVWGDKQIASIRTAVVCSRQTSVSHSA